ncbi:MAG: ADP-ribosylation factor-like protein [Promethearchaeota archaeon]
MSSSSSETSLTDYFRIILLGSPKVGKTSIIHWILDLSPLDEYHPTIGLKFYNLDTILNKNQYFLQFCDVSGNEIYFDPPPSFLNTATVAILVFDNKNKDSQLEIPKLYDKVREHLSPTQILVVGNRFDNEKRKIPKTLSSWANTHKLTIYPLSIQEDIGKSLLLQNIIQIITNVSNKQTMEPVKV